MRYLLLCLLLCSLLLCSCTKIVYIPTPVPCPEPPVVTRPHLPIADLKGDETYGEMIRAYGASLKAERGYSGELERLLNGYRKN